MAVSSRSYVACPSGEDLGGDQRDMVLLEVDALHDDVNGLADLEHITRMRDPLVGADGRDVKQAVDALGHSDERTEGLESGDRAFHGCAGWGLLDELRPRIHDARPVLESKRDAVLLRLELDDHHLDGVTDLDLLAGVRHSRPSQLADVDQTLDAAEIDERAEVTELGHLALEHIADRERIGHGLTRPAPIGFEQDAAGDHRALGVVPLRNAEVKLLPDDALGIGALTLGDLA